ncbi:glycosyltransferase family 2 protein [Hydrogenophaga sp.]|uniref:glycosyltransferase family 2 protein n=1 Tax=Hydrogenophaga sp. TaxID=1904254 RepID=UPI00271BB14B|nr:glycosyltransferase family 2 protein [Hydrogenophaga sp.]MDO8903945.1 glycosyltransferase family 2 protein [Hydrogenophaga sp.]
MQSPGEAVSALADVTVVVVTHESAHCIAELDGLLGSCPHVIVSDNASADGTPTLARQRWPRARVLEHERNLGFGAANNRALALVQTPFALLLNPDCELSAEGLGTLLMAARNMVDAALFAPQLASPTGKLEVNYRWPKTVWNSIGPPATGMTCVGFVCGAAMLLRMERFQQIGFFDERFFLYYEDDDLCLRLFQAGLAMVLVPEVKAIHRSRSSSKGSRPWRNEYSRGFHHAQSKLTFTAKHRSIAEALQLRRKLLVTTSVALPIRMLAFVPRLVARMLGRWRGLKSWKIDD